MQVKRIAERGHSVIHLIFISDPVYWAFLSYHLSLRSLFCLFLSGRFYAGFTVPSDKQNFSSNILGTYDCFAAGGCYPTYFSALDKREYFLENRT